MKTKTKTRCQGSTLTFQTPGPEPTRYCGDAGRTAPTPGRPPRGGSPARTHLLDGEASRWGESALNCRSRTRERRRCSRSFSSSFWGKSSRTGVPGVLRGAFRGRDMENTRSEGEEALWGCPRISEEKQLIMADSDGREPLLRKPATEYFLCLKWGLGALIGWKFTARFPPRSFPTLIFLYSLSFFVGGWVSDASLPN